MVRTMIVEIVVCAGGDSGIRMLADGGDESGRLMTNDLCRTLDTTHLVEEIHRGALTADYREQTDVAYEENDGVTSGREETCGDQIFVLKTQKMSPLNEGLLQENLFQLASLDELVFDNFLAVVKRENELDAELNGSDK
ncbi:hypothetical protein PR048_025284 [Dryococelus australis]|uniref:Uncharacterized protein n=1 Tax=Dryococelus australis TaxID=614101 RepID=A0ABQ9GQV0_9NEOP|nr:hypothetical protein PR048_025284 [Dryococelus australis]